MIDFDKIRKVRNQLGLDKDARLSNPSESTRINNIYTKEKALKPTQKVDPDRTGIEEFVPVIGDALDFTKIGEDINDKNYGQAALGLGLLLIPNAIEKPIKALGKVAKNSLKKIVNNKQARPELKRMLGFDPNFKYKGYVKDYDTFDEIVDLGEQNAWDYFGHPVTRKTDEHNRQLYKKIYKNDNLKDITEKRIDEYIHNMPRTNVISDPKWNSAGGLSPDRQDLLFNASMPQSKEDAANTIFHEFRHAGYVGEVPPTVKNVNEGNKFYQMKNSHLYKPAEQIDPNWSDYLLQSSEGYNNALDVGRDLGLQLGQKYPGKDNVLKLLKSYKGLAPEVVDAFDVSTTPHVKRVWDAMTGQYIWIPAVLGGVTLNQTKNEKNR